MYETEHLSGRDVSSYLGEQIYLIRSILAVSLDLNLEDVKINFPMLKNFHSVNNVYKSSWAIHSNELQKLFFAGNFLAQGGEYSKRSIRSPFGSEVLSSLTSLANTFSYSSSICKQNWALDLNIYGKEEHKLNLSVNEYKEFLRLLNMLRAQWLLHLSEEGKFDFVICEFSEPSDPLYFIDLESIDSNASKIKTYFKLVSEDALKKFRQLSTDTEFEGRFLNLQPGAWLREDILVELLSFNNQYNVKIEPNDDYTGPFKMGLLRPTA